MQSELYRKAEEKDVQLLKDNPWYENLEPLKKCNCGGRPTIDASMALIQYENCGLCFAYRYNKGVIPYHTWQINHKGNHDRR